MLKQFTATVKRWQKRQQAIAELNHLSDRDLTDLGISRHDIRHIV